MGVERRGAACAPRRPVSGTEELRAMAQDVTSGVCGAPRTMRDLLGVATLVLAAGMPWVLPAAAGLGWMIGKNYLGVKTSLVPNATFLHSR